MLVRGRSGFAVEAEVATTFRSRLRGLMGREPVPLLIPSASVHGFWLREELWAAGIDPDGRVVGLERLRRRRLIWMRGATWILELPLSLRPPQPGERLVFEPLTGEADRHGLHPLRLRHTYRQPG